jgi:hypothetical protein
MTDAELQVIIKGIAHGVRAELAKRAARIAALETRPAGVEYEGTWDAQKTYPPGDS